MRFDTCHTETGTAWAVPDLTLLQVPESSWLATEYRDVLGCPCGHGCMICAANFCPFIRTQKQHSIFVVLMDILCPPCYVHCKSLSHQPSIG